MKIDFFFYGTLRDPEVRRIVLGPGATGLSLETARLPGFRCGPIEDGRFPGIVAEEGAEAVGVLARRVSLEAAARTSYFEGDGFHYDIALKDIRLEGGPGAAWVYIPTDALPVEGGKWVIDEWAARWRGEFLASSRETMSKAPADRINRHRLAWVDRLSRSPKSLPPGSAGSASSGWCRPHVLRPGTCR